MLSRVQKAKKRATTTYEGTCAFPEEFVEQLAHKGLEGLPERVRVLVNDTLRIEHPNYWL